MFDFWTDYPCKGPTKIGFGDPREWRFGFVINNDTGDGETFSRCWSIEFHYGWERLQIAFYDHAITSDGACIKVMIHVIDSLLYDSCPFLMMLTLQCNFELLQTQRLYHQANTPV